MTGRLPWALTAVAVVALIGAAVTFAVVASGDDDQDDGGSLVVAPGLGMMGGIMGSGMGMMGGVSLSPGDVEPVTSMTTAARRVGEWLDASDFEGFRTAEVMSFSNGYYVAVEDAEGEGAFELLVDPATGWISLEPGPSMMWNTTYGMLGGRYDTGMTGGILGSGMGMTGGYDSPRETPLSPTEAQEIAGRWLSEALPGETAKPDRAFPGYYTFDTERDGRAQAMVSVNARTGAVWYHVWHGSFVDEVEP